MVLINFLWWLLDFSWRWVKMTSMGAITATTELQATDTQSSALIAELRHEITQQAITIRSQSQTIEKLTLELLMFKRRMFGRSAEASDLLQVQGQLFPVATAEIDLPVPPAAPLTRTPSAPKAPLVRKGRMILPDHLPRREQVLMPPGATDAENRLLPHFVQIGEERTERLACTPASFWVDVIVRPQLAMTPAAKADPQIAPLIAGGCKEGISIAKLPRFVIDSGLMHETLLAHVILSKIDDHLPLHRQSEMLLRDCGVRLPVSTLSDAILCGADALRPLEKALFQRLLTDHTAIHIDETGCPTLAKGQTAKTRIWTYASTAGPQADGRMIAPIICYRYTEDKSGTHLPKLLANYRGYLHADASNVYDQLYAQRPDILEVACFAHARRKFYDVAVASTAPTIAHEAVERINALFHIEAHCTEARMTPAQRHAYRTEKAKPLVDALRPWAIDQCAQLSPTSKTALAFRYLCIRPTAHILDLRPRRSDSDCTGQKWSVRCVENG
jgi:transposase